MSELPPNLIRRVLVATQFDYSGQVYWTVQQDGSLRLAVDCSDFFDLATADAEPIETEADVELLERTLRDLQRAEGTCFPTWLTELYAARRRRRTGRLGSRTPSPVRDLFAAISEASGDR